MPEVLDDLFERFPDLPWPRRRRSPTRERWRPMTAKGLPPPPRRARPGGLRVGPHPAPLRDLLLRIRAIAHAEHQRAGGGSASSHALIEIVTLVDSALRRTR